ncbi:MAG: TrkH family potassium uptake protein [Firmicutes bacterium]|nr:TrkH family potassium uptake protein [Bacillota bacterium]
MNLSLQAFSKVTGLAFMVIGLSMLPSLLVACIYHELHAILAFVITIMITTVTGWALMFVGRDFEDDLKIRDGFLVVTLCWLVAGFAGALPFAMSGAIPNFFDAFFESCSGFSTTGCTILTDIEALPKSLLFWRSFTHWIGGMGILIFAIALMPSLGISGQNAAASEAPGPTLDKVTAKMSDTAKSLYFIYILFTVVQTILLLLGGMSLFDALVHTFGTVGTGGFSSSNDGIAHFGSVYIEVVIIVFMILCGTNFNLFFLSFKQKYNYFIHDSEFKMYAGIILVFSILIALNLYFSGVFESGDSIRYAVFNVSSVITTTGYATTDFNLWPTFSKMLLLMLMFVGGCASSTGGGIKVIRILMLLKLIRRGIATRLHPNAVVNIRINETTIPSDTITNTACHAFIYLMIIFISTVLISLNNFDLVTNFTAVITCVGNIGPGFELVGPMGNFSMFSGAAKFLLSMLMLAGRLELFTLFIIFTPKFWHPDR